LTTFRVVGGKRLVVDGRLAGRRRGVRGREFD